MKKLLAIAVLVLCSANVPAQISSSTDGQGNKWYYTSFPMPRATWKTKIGVLRFGQWQTVVAAPFYYYGDKINSDIYVLRNYLNTNGIPYRNGTCVTFPYTQPCLY